MRNDFLRVGQELFALNRRIAGKRGEGLAQLIEPMPLILVFLLLTVGGGGCFGHPGVGMLFFAVFFTLNGIPIMEGFSKAKSNHTRNH